jgi:hypothetical protein
MSGFLAGLGGTCTSGLGQGSQDCGVNTAIEGSIGPDLSGWFLVPVVILVVGGLTV